MCVDVFCFLVGLCLVLGLDGDGEVVDLVVVCFGFGCDCLWFFVELGFCFLVGLLCGLGLDDDFVVYDVFFVLVVFFCFCAVWWFL